MAQIAGEGVIAQLEQALKIANRHALLAGNIGGRQVGIGEVRVDCRGDPAKMRGLHLGHRAVGRARFHQQGAGDEFGHREFAGGDIRLFELADTAGEHAQHRPGGERGKGAAEHDRGVQSGAAEPYRQRGARQLKKDHVVIAAPMQAPGHVHAHNREIVIGEIGGARTAGERGAALEDEDQHDRRIAGAGLGGQQGLAFADDAGEPGAGRGQADVDATVGDLSVTEEFGLQAHLREPGLPGFAAHDERQAVNGGRIVDHGTASCSCAAYGGGEVCFRHTSPKTLTGQKHHSETGGEIFAPGRTIS